MEDFDKYISNVQVAETGSSIRAPLAKILEKFAEEGKSATTLNNHNSDFFAKQTDMSSLLPMDTEPKKRSTKLVTSGGVYDAFGDIFHFDWGDDD